MKNSLIALMLLLAMPLLSACPNKNDAKKPAEPLMLENPEPIVGKTYEPITDIATILPGSTLTFQDDATIEFLTIYTIPAASYPAGSKSRRAGHIDCRFLGTHNGTLSVARGETLTVEKIISETVLESGGLPFVWIGVTHDLIRAVECQTTKKYAHLLSTHELFYAFRGLLTISKPTPDEAQKRLAALHKTARDTALEMGYSLMGPNEDVVEALKSETSVYLIVLKDIKKPVKIKAVRFGNGNELCHLRIETENEVTIPAGAVFPLVSPYEENEIFWGDPVDGLIIVIGLASELVTKFFCAFDLPDDVVIDSGDVSRRDLFEFKGGDLLTRTNGALALARE